MFLFLQVKCGKKCQVEQHKTTAKHQRNLATTSSNGSAKQQTFISAMVASSQEKHSFNQDLCEAFVKADIPLHKLTNKDFRVFLAKYMKREIPDESTIRKKYISDTYEKTMNQIREDIKEAPIWLSVDETTDVCGRYMVHVIVGKLTVDEPGKGHLILCKEVEKTNHATIARMVQEAVHLLWQGQGQNFETRLRAFVTDSAAYMLKAGEFLKVFYPNMLHITCLAHGMHRVAEEVRRFSPAVNALISSVKKVFLKAPSRITTFKEMLPGTPLPPEPVLTRWGTWIAAALYYSEHGIKLMDVIERFNDTDSIAIQKAKEAFRNKETWKELSFIKAHFSSLPNIIENLEKQEAPLSSTVEIVLQVQSEASNWPGEKGACAKKKLHAVLGRNPDWEEIVKVNDVLQGLPAVDTSVNDCAVFKYVPIVSADVERSFSKLKKLLSRDRLSLSTTNIEKYIIVQYNKF